MSGVGGHGSVGGSLGGRARVGHEQGVSPSFTTPVLEHLGRPYTAQCAAMSLVSDCSESVTVIGEAVDSENCPTCGKSAGIVPSCTHAYLER